MKKWLTVIFLMSFCISAIASEGRLGISNEFSSRDGQQTVRSVTPGEIGSMITRDLNRPIRNPHIMAQVLER